MRDWHQLHCAAGVDAAANPAFDHSDHMFYTPTRSPTVFYLVAPEGATSFGLTVEHPVLL
jgi:hypothetical protein